MDVLESCFPYALLRNAYHEVYQVSHLSLSKKVYLNSQTNRILWNPDRTLC